MTRPAVRRRVVERARPAYLRVLDVLNQRVFPAIVAYATHPLTIFGTMLLLIPLIVFASVTALSLVLGNYTNVISATVSSIVLAQALQHHRESTRRHDEHSARLSRIEAHIAHGTAKKARGDA